jgi:hypothetical protein
LECSTTLFRPLIWECYIVDTYFHTSASTGTTGPYRLAFLLYQGVEMGMGSFMESSYLVDPASSHMLVSKIKPCMSKYKQVCTVKLRMAH